MGQVWARVIAETSLVGMEGWQEARKEAQCLNSIELDRTWVPWVLVKKRPAL